MITMLKSGGRWGGGVGGKKHGNITKDKIHK